MSSIDSRGIEWMIDAAGCPASVLRSRPHLDRLFATVVGELALHPIGKPRWHRFPGPGGLTGFWMLQESHLACHTFPEYGSICINLFCCRPRPSWPWEERLARLLGARRVSVQSHERRHDPVLQAETA